MMISFDRQTDGNETKRPETSKLSRSSKRAQFNMTMNNFNLNNTDKRKLQNKTGKKVGTQMNFYQNTSQNSSKVINYSSIVPNSDSHIDIKQSLQPKKLIPTQESVQKTPHQEASDFASNNPVFKIGDADLQNGLTLDKVLGGGFKKIAIFDANLDEFARNGPPEDKKKTNRVSTSIDEEEFKQFDIAETENEEENADSKEDIQYQSQVRRGDREERKSAIENTQLMEKYRVQPRKTKLIYRRKSKILPNEVSDWRDKKEYETRNEDSQMNSHMGRESVLGKNESKSLSPRTANDQKKNRFQSIAPEKQKFFLNNTKYGLSNEMFYGLKRVPYEAQNDLKSQTQNKFRISLNKFKSTKENLKTESDDLTGNYIKKPLQIKALLNDFNFGSDFARERRTAAEQDGDKTTSRSNSIANTEKIIENIKRLQGEKYGKNHFEQKITRENKLITEKIKKVEQERMQKYSKMFHFNNEEKIHLLKHKVDEGGRRLSTPMKDIDSAKYIPKKFINPKEFI